MAFAELRFVAQFNIMISIFTAINFETATGYRKSICQVAIVRVENGRFTKEVEMLIKPPDNYYWEKFTDHHGISAADTENAQSFDKAWPQIEPYIKGQNVVAHAGFSFDFDCLARTLDFYGLEEPEYEKYCTHKIWGHNLASLCKSHKIPLDHHDALSEARACAMLFLRHLRLRGK